MARGTLNMQDTIQGTSALPQRGCGLHLKLWSLRTPLLQVAEKVAAVLEYACHNAVEPFLEPVLELSHTIVQRDVAEIEAGGRSGGALTSVFLDQVRALAAAAAAYLCDITNMLQDARLLQLGALQRRCEMLSCF